MENGIKLVQIPVIENQLKKVGTNVSERLAALDIENQVATIDTVKALKSLRAELNHESKEFRDQLKEVDIKVSAPMNELKDLFKIEITEKYANADDLLKTKIGTVENQVKEEKESNLKVYFIELCQSENIDFLNFPDTGIEVNLSTTEKAYKEQINKFVQRVCSDVDLIRTEEFEAEIMTEYKFNLNASLAIKTVRERKRLEKEEKDRIKAKEDLRRKTMLQNIAMPFDAMTKSFVYNDDIYISENVVYELDKSEFMTKFIEIEEKIKVVEKAKIVEQKEPIKVDEKKQVEKVIEKPEIKEPLKAPVKEEKIELVTAQFEATATYSQLKALGQYMKDNNIKYKNI